MVIGVQSLDRGLTVVDQTYYGLIFCDHHSYSLGSTRVTRLKPDLIFSENCYKLRTLLIRLFKWAHWCLHYTYPCYHFPGPGPGRYFLPSTVGFQQHDVSKKMEPAYSFGRRLDLPKGHSKFVGVRTAQHKSVAVIVIKILMKIKY